jgi:hypothetical protein
MGKQVEFLKDHPGAQTELVDQIVLTFSFFTTSNTASIHFDFPKGWFFQVINTAQQGALTGTASSDDTDDLLRVNFERNFFQDLEPSKKFIQVRDSDDRLHILPLAS